MGEQPDVFNRMTDLRRALVRARDAVAVPRRAIRGASPLKRGEERLAGRDAA